MTRAFGTGCVRQTLRCLRAAFIVSILVMGLAPSAMAFDVSTRRIVAPPGETQESEGSFSRPLPPLPDDARVFTSLIGYETRRDDDYSFNVVPTADQVRVDWNRGRGQLDVMTHKISLGEEFRVVERITLTSQRIRDENNDWRARFPIDPGQRCISIVEVRKADGSDDDASYRIATNNKSGGAERQCEVTATLGNGTNRAFEFILTVLSWEAGTPGVSVVVDTLETSSQTPSTVSLAGFAPSNGVTIANPIVDWGSDDDVSFHLTYSPGSSGVSLSRKFGSREIKYELISLDGPRARFPGCEDKDGDGYGVAAHPSCTFPSIDCDDHDPAVNPGISSEIPDDFVDNDCNALTDDNGCRFGDDCSSCATGVLAQLAGFADPDGVSEIEYSSSEEASLSRTPANGIFDFLPKLGNDFGGAESLTQIDENGGHVQGFARIQSARPNASIVLTRDNRNGDTSGILLARLGKIANNGGNRLASRGVDSGLSVEVEAERAFVPILETDHPGGIQTIGSILAVPIFCDDSSCGGKAQVQFYDMTACYADATAENCLLNQLSLPNTNLGGGITCSSASAAAVGGFFGGVVGGIVGGIWGGGLCDSVLNRKAYFVALTTMEDGRYLLLVNRSDAGHADVFVSDSDTLSSQTVWGDRSSQVWQRNYKNGSTYQNMNFVTECGSNKRYLLGFEQNGFDTDTNVIDVFDVDIENGSDVDITRIQRARYFAEQDDSCEMKGGANIYVSPHGEMIVYCMQGRIAGDVAENDAVLMPFAEHTSSANGSGLQPE